MPSFKTQRTKKRKEFPHLNETAKQTTNEQNPCKNQNDPVPSGIKNFCKVLSTFTFYCVD